MCRRAKCPSCTAGERALRQGPQRRALIALYVNADLLFPWTGQLDAVDCQSVLGDLYESHGGSKVG
jgi:hypothetical protein